MRQANAILQEILSGYDACCNKKYKEVFVLGMDGCVIELLLCSCFNFVFLLFVSYFCINKVLTGYIKVQESVSRYVHEI